MTGFRRGSRCSRALGGGLDRWVEEQLCRDLSFFWHAAVHISAVYVLVSYDSYPSIGHKMAVTVFRSIRIKEPNGQLSNDFPKHFSDVGLYVGYHLKCLNISNDFNGKWRTGEDSNPRPLDS